MKRPRRRWYKIRVCAINTHAGVGLQHGVVAWVLKRHPLISIFSFQEVRNRRGLVDALPPSFDVYPRTDQESTQYIAYKSRVYSLIEVIRKDITNSKHAREMLMLVLEHRRTGRCVVVSNIHPNPLGRGFAGDPGAVRKHVAQVRKFVDAHEETMAPNDVHICLGDVNERLAHTHTVEDSAIRQFDRIKMHLTAKTANSIRGPLRLMGIFSTHGPKTQVRWHRSYDTGVKGMDHEVVVAGFKIRHPDR